MTTFCGELDSSLWHGKLLVACVTPGKTDIGSGEILFTQIEILKEKQSYNFLRIINAHWPLQSYSGIHDCDGVSLQPVAFA